MRTFQIPEEDLNRILAELGEIPTKFGRNAANSILEIVAKTLREEESKSKNDT